MESKETRQTSQTLKLLDHTDEDKIEREMATYRFIYVPSKDDPEET
jgi:hypothetical protein